MGGRVIKVDIMSDVLECQGLGWSGTPREVWNVQGPSGSDTDHECGVFSGGRTSLPELFPQAGRNLETFRIRHRTSPSNSVPNITLLYPRTHPHNRKTDISPFSSRLSSIILLL